MKWKRLVMAACLALPIWTVLAWGEESAGTEEPNMDEASRPQKIILVPQEGKMNATAQVPILNNQRFSLGIPETIGERGGIILNFPGVNIEWNPPEELGAVSYRYVAEGNVDYSVRLVPDVDLVDVEMRVKNISDRGWREVFFFNCLSPTAAPEFKDWKLERTYMSKNGKPFRMDGTTRINEGPQAFMRKLQFYAHEDYEPVSKFVQGFRSTSPDKTDSSYMVTLSEDGTSYMGATSPRALFLFDNLVGRCIHSSPTFGDIGPGEEKKVKARLYFGKGTLEDFLKRYFSDFPEAKPKTE